MNGKQKAVIVLGILLVILSWLFPYYEGEYRIQPIRKVDMGYHFILNPPSQTDVYRKINGESPKYSSYLAFCNSRIVTSYLYAQLVVILLACAGLYLLFSDKKKPDREKDQGVSFYKN